MKIFFLVWNLIRFKREKYNPWLDLFLYHKTSIQNSFVQLTSYHNILSDNQYGFRNYHSTTYALACLYDKISSAIENN